MRKLRVCLALALLTGCGGREQPRSVIAGKVAPRPGDKVFLPTYADLWSNLDDMREQKRLIYSGQWKKDSPEAERIDRSRIGYIGGDSLIEVLEVGEDYAAVDGIKDRSGEPLHLHGFVERWW